LDWHFKSGDNIHGILDLNPIYERLFEPLAISPGVILPRGEYRFTRFKTNLISTATKRRLSGSLTVTFGNYWSGKAEQVQTSLTYKLPPRFTISVTTNQTFARLPEGDFTARILTSNVNYAASPRLSISNLIQYDNRSRNLGWQSRIRARSLASGQREAWPRASAQPALGAWTLRPGNDLFFAFNQGWIHEEGDNRRFRTQDSKVSAKFQYSFRF
jgi:hypothetical protein